MVASLNDTQRLNQAFTSRLFPAVFPPHSRDGADGHTLSHGVSALRLHGLRHQQHRAHPASAHHPGVCVRHLLHPLRWGPLFMGFPALPATFAAPGCVFMANRSTAGSVWPFTGLQNPSSSSLSLCISAVNLLQQQVAALLTFAPLCGADPLPLTPTCWRTRESAGKKGGEKGRERMEGIVKRSSVTAKTFGWQGPPNKGCSRIMSVM